MWKSDTSWLPFGMVWLFKTYDKNRKDLCFLFVSFVLFFILIFKRIIIIINNDNNNYRPINYYYYYLYLCLCRPIGRQRLGNIP